MNYSFQNGAGSQNITGSPDYGGRVTVKGSTNSGCSGDIYKQFNTSAFAPPQIGSIGLESGVDYMRGCFYQNFDFALQREFRFSETRRLSFRLDAFNALNQSQITGRNTTLQVASQTDATIVNLPFDSSGNLLSSRLKPNASGFGQATGWQNGRTLQAWLRFTFRRHRGIGSPVEGGQDGIPGRSDWYGWPRPGSTWPHHPPRRGAY